MKQWEGLIGFNTNILVGKIGKHVISIGFNGFFTWTIGNVEHESGKMRNAENDLKKNQGGYYD